jgi:hypothetical protein
VADVVAITVRVAVVLQEAVTEARQALSHTVNVASDALVKKTGSSGLGITTSEHGAQVPLVRSWDGHLMKTS